MADVQVDRDAFHKRLNSFVTQWKGDKRSGDTFFGGVGSIVILMGKTEEASGFAKNGAFQVGLFYYSDTASTKSQRRSEFNWMTFADHLMIHSSGC